MGIPGQYSFKFELIAGPIFSIFKLDNSKLSFNAKSHVPFSLSVLSLRDSDAACFRATNPSLEGALSKLFKTSMAS